MLTPKLEEAYNISMNLLFGGVNVVHCVNRKIRKKLKFRILRILISDPVGIQTQDLQNQLLTLLYCMEWKAVLLLVERSKILGDHLIS